MKQLTSFFSRNRKIMALFLSVFLLGSVLTLPAYAAGKGDVAGAVEETWKEAVKQIKDVCDKVVFPVLTLVLAVLFFVKLSTAYFEYRKHGQFEWMAPAILFAGLVVTIVVPKFIWSIVAYGDNLQKQKEMRFKCSFPRLTPSYLIRAPVRDTKNNAMVWKIPKFRKQQV